MKKKKTVPAQLHTNAKSMSFALICAPLFRPIHLADNPFANISDAIHITITTHSTKTKREKKNTRAFHIIIVVQVEYHATHFSFYLKNLITFYLSMGIHKCYIRNDKKTKHRSPKNWNNTFLHNLPRNCVSDIRDSGTQKTQKISLDIIPIW